MKDYEYINENGDYIDYWTLVEDNKQMNRELERLYKREKALLLLLNWAEECDWGFDNFVDNEVVDWDEFEKCSEDLSYIESMIKYAEMYIDKRGEK